MDYDYGARIYDARVGKFLSTDPITSNYPELTPYQFASNRPIDGIDQDGLEYAPAGRYNGMARDGTAVRIMTYSPATIVANAAIVKKISDYNAEIVTGIDYMGRRVTGSRYAVRIEIHNSGVERINSPRVQQTAENLQGFFGSMGYYINWDKGSDYGSVADDVMYSFGGLDQRGFLSQPGTMESTPNVDNTEVNASAALFGSWVNESTKGWSRKAIEYQEYVTGVKAGKAYKLNDVRFDGIKGGILLDAKSSYDNFVNNKTGQFEEWFRTSESGAPALLDEAKRQKEQL